MNSSPDSGYISFITLHQLSRTFKMSVWELPFPPLSPNSRLSTALEGDAGASSPGWVAAFVFHRHAVRAGPLCLPVEPAGPFRDVWPQLRHGLEAPFSQGPHVAAPWACGGGTALGIQPSHDPNLSLPPFLSHGPTLTNGCLVFLIQPLKQKC